MAERSILHKKNSTFRIIDSNILQFPEHWPIFLELFISFTYKNISFRSHQGSITNIMKCVRIPLHNVSKTKKTENASTKLECSCSRVAWAAVQGPGYWNLFVVIHVNKHNQRHFLRKCIVSTENLAGENNTRINNENLRKTLMFRVAD